MNILSILTFLNRIQKQVSSHILSRDPHPQYDQLRFYLTKSGFPTLGVEDRLYIDEETSTIYVWSNGSYKLFSGSAAALRGGGGISVQLDTDSNSTVVLNNDRGSTAVGFHAQESDPHPQYKNRNNFSSFIGNFGSINATSVDQSFAIVGINGLSTQISFSPDKLVISPTYASPVSLGSSNHAGVQNSFARSDHVHLDPVIAHLAESNPHSQYILTSQKGATNGIAPLGSDAKIPSIYLPGFVDDVLEYNGLANFPITGESGKIYVDIGTNQTYRWSGSTYTEISASPGTTDSVTEGSLNKYFTESRARGTLLTGLSFTLSDVISTTDSILSAFGKLQKQITDHSNATNPHPQYVNKNAYSTVTGNTGSVSADTVLDSIAIVGANGITTTTATSPKKLEITPVYSTSSASLSNANNAGSANTVARGDHTHLDPTIAHVADADPHTQYLLKTARGAVNGVAPLGSDSKIPSIYLPSYVDDVLEFSTLGAFPATGETGKIYVTLDTNKVYRWSGSVYVYITSGGVDSVAGKTGVVTLVKADVGLGNVDNTSDLNKPVSTAQQTALNLKANLDSPSLTGVPTSPTAVVGSNTTQIATTAFVNAEIANDATPISHVGTGGAQHAAATTTVAGFMSASDKAKLDGIAANANNYTLPVATTTVLGGVKQSTGVAIDAAGLLSVSYGATAGTAVQGNDTRVVADQVAGTASIRTLGTGAQQAAAGNHTHAGVYQPLDADLTAIAALAGTTGLLRKTATDTWSLDTTTYIPTTQKGVASGVAPLDENVKIASTYLPDYVNDVLEFATVANFPATGETGKLYIALDNNKAYRFNGTGYTEVSASPANTDALTEGTSNLYFTYQRVRDTVLSGLSLITGGVIAAADTVITALGKLQKQITDHADAVNPHPQYTNQNAFSIVTGNSGTSNSDTVTDTLAITGSNGISTAATDTPDGLVISPTYGSPVALGSVSSAGTANTFARSDHVHLDPTIAHVASSDPHTQYILKTSIGAANGVVPLGSDSKIAATYLPAYVDDVLEFSTLSAFPATGETGKIYVALDTNKTYRWSGTVYVYITSGAVDSVAGKTGVVLLVKADVGLGNVDNTSDADKPVSTAQQTALNLKANLDSPAFTGSPLATTAPVNDSSTRIATTAFVNAEIANDATPISHVGTGGTQHAVATTTVSGFMSSADKVKLDSIGANANNYSLPPASTTVLGGIKIGTGLTADANGVTSVSYGSSAGTAVQGNDTRVTADQAVGTASIRTLGTGALQAAPGNHTHAGVYQPLDADLTAIAALVGTTGLLKKTAANTWTLDTNAYITGNQSITFTGDATGTGTTAVTLTLSNSGVTAGTYNNDPVAVQPFTVDAKGRITATGTKVTITPAFASITGKPTTLSGYGITDAQAFITPGTTAQYWRGDKTWQTLDKNAVGLGNVENTALSTWAGSTNLTTAGNLTASSLSVTGNLVVNGTTTTVHSTTVTLDDPVLTLGGDTTPTVDDNKDRGVEFKWHNGTVAKLGFFGFDDSTGKFTFIPDASNTSEVFTGTKGILDASLDWTDILNKPTTRAGYGITDAQPLDADLTAIAGLTGTSGLLRKTASDTWSLDTNAYITGNQNITFTGDVSGSGTTSVTLTLATVATAGTYRSVTINAKGLVTSGTNPTTLSGYGITDAQPLDGDLTAIAALVGTTGLLKKTAANTWTLDTTAYSTLTLGSTAGAALAATGSAGAATTAARSDHVHPFPTAANVGAEPTITTGTSAQFWRGDKVWATLDLTYLPSAHVKANVSVATTTALTVSMAGNVLTNTGTLAALTIDGASLVLGARVLVKDQVSSAQNGIYSVTNAGSASVAWTLTRTTDADSSAKITGAVVNVTQGAVNGGLRFDTDFKASDTLNTTSMIWNRIIDTGMAASATPIVASTGAVGASFKYAREDHVHPVQTSVSGNAGTATKLETPRTINGVSFDGTANITINAVDSTARIASSEKGAALGVVPLDENTKIASIYLPSYVDDVLEYNTLGLFPGAGETGKIYIALDTNKTYRYSGSTYVEISASPGSTDSVVEGSTNLYFTYQRVRQTLLDGLSTATNAVISATDTVIAALGKLQAQVSTVGGLINNHLNRTDNPHNTTAAQVGADPAGTANTVFTNHLSATNPHGNVYYTKTESDARYQSSTGHQLIKATLASNETANTTTGITLSGHTFTIPPGKSMELSGAIGITAAAADTSVYFSIRVNQGSGANGSVLGICNLKASVSDDGSTTGLLNGAGGVISTTIASSKGIYLNASPTVTAMGGFELYLKNNSTNALTTVTININPEINGKSVTALAGSSAIGVVG